ncbi:MAG: hypothetical protein ACK421_09640 [Pseudanabaenaceae cyanobacterium]
MLALSIETYSSYSMVLTTPSREDYIKIGTFLATFMAFCAYYGVALITTMQPQYHSLPFTIGCIIFVVVLFLTAILPPVERWEFKSMIIIHTKTNPLSMEKEEIIWTAVDFVLINKQAEENYITIHLKNDKRKPWWQFSHPGERRLPLQKPQDLKRVHDYLYRYIPDKIKTTERKTTSGLETLLKIIKTITDLLP